MLCCFWIFELFIVREHIPFVLVRSSNVYISATLLGWCSFWASLLHCWMVASLFLFFKNQFPASWSDSLSLPFSLWLKARKSWIWKYRGPSPSFSAQHKNEMKKNKSTLFRSLHWVVFPKPLFSTEFTKSCHVESGLNSTTTFPI